MNAPRARGLTLILLLNLLSGCLVLPVPTPEHGLLSGHGEIDPQSLEGLEVGKTTRAQVLLMLGEPGLSLENGRFLVYEWSVTRAYVLWAVGAYYAGSGGIAPIGKRYLFLVEFDADGILQRMQRQPVKLFDSFAASVDAWTPDTAAKLTPLSRPNAERVINAPQREKWVLNVPTDTLRVQVDDDPGHGLGVALPAAPDRRGGPHPVGFKTPGNHHAVATVSTAESPNRLVYDSFANGWRQMGFQVGDDGGIGLSWKVRNFEVSSPVTLLSWSAQATVELDVTITRRDAGAPDHRVYRTTQTVKTLFGPGPEDYGKAIVKCLTELTVQLGNDLIALK